MNGGAARRASWAAGLLLSVGFVASLLPIRSEIAWLFDHDRTHSTHDFGIFFTTAECLLARGCDSYPMPLTRYPNLNPPHFHLLLMPFVTLGVHGAFLAWLILGACSVAIAIRRLSTETGFPGSPGEIVLSVAFLITSSVTWTLILTGQVYAVLSWPLYEVWFAARRHKWTRATILLTILATIKPFLLVPLGWVVWKQPRTLGVVVMTAAVVFGGGMMLFGFDSYAGWSRHLQSIQPPGHPADGSIVSVMTRLFSPTPWYAPIVNWPDAVTPLWIVFSLALAADLMRWAPRAPIDHAWLGSMAAAFLLSPRGWVYAASFLIGSAAVVARQAEWRTLVLAVAATLLLMPGAITGFQQPSGWLTPLTGSIYAWVWLLLYVGARRLGTHATTERESVVPRRINVLGVGISALNLQNAIDIIEQWISAGARHYVNVCTVHTVMECQRDARLRQIVNQSELATPDGMPLVWLSWLHGHRDANRVYGPDLLLALCERSQETGTRHFFFGGAPGVAERLVQRLRSRFPRLVVAGTYTPPFRAADAEEDPAVIDAINAAAADIVWVGLGTPKQDYWVARHRGRLTAPALIAVGAAFDFHAGLVRQAPRWIQRSGFEWLFRLCQEPRRLAYRYLVYNPLFVVQVALQLIGLRAYRLD